MDTALDREAVVLAKILSGEQDALHKVLAADHVLVLGRACSPMMLGLSSQQVDSLALRARGMVANHGVERGKAAFIQLAKEEGIVGNKKAGEELFLAVRQPPIREKRLVTPWS